MSLNEKIPKLVHYCWFGSTKQNIIINKCISTFHKLTDGKIICWNEANIPELTNKYAKKHYENKNWAFVSDYIRLWILYYYGGIYLDTDIEVKKKLPDSFFDADLIVGYAFDDLLCTAFIMVKPYHPFIKYLLNLYDTYSSDKKIVNNTILTQAFIDYYPHFVLDGKYREFAPNCFIYPRYYFDSPTYKKDGGFTVHHGTGTWYQPKYSIVRLIRPLVKLSRFYIKPFGVLYQERVNRKMMKSNEKFLEIYKKNTIKSKHQK